MSVSLDRLPSYSASDRPAGKLPVLTDRILTAGPTISDLEVQYGLDAIKNGWNNDWALYLKKFEREFAEYLGVKHAMATSSCTGAMHLALLAFGIGPGDEVIVPELTWVATASAVKYVGATPVFCDVDPESWTMLPASAEKCITSRTKAIIPVHLYGHPCDMDPILALAAKHNLIVMEDSAQAVGAEYKGRKTGSMGHASAFSFQGAKALVTGEGGMLATNDAQLMERAQFKGDHGRSPNKVLFNIEVGYKYKMSNVQAALGLAQIQRVNEIIQKKVQIFNWYKERLADIDVIKLNPENSWAKNIFWMSSIVLSDSLPLERDDFIQRLSARNIDSRPVFYPLSCFPMFEKQNNPNAYHIGLRGINLPSGHNRTEEEVDYICQHIRDLVGKPSNLARYPGWLAYREETKTKIAAEKLESAVEIPIVDAGKKIGSLQPITVKSLDSEADIELLASWRQASQNWFPSQSAITTEGTKRWLEKALLSISDRILFFVCNEAGEKVGHLGLYRFDYEKRFCELDNVIRGAAIAPGLMTHASRTLIEWATNHLAVSSIYLRVFSDNRPALKLYQKLGFAEIRRDPQILKTEADGTTVWTIP